MSETPAPNPDHLTVIEQLRALAGVSADTNAFEIVQEGRTIRVVLEPPDESLTLKTKVPTATAETRRVFDGYRGGKDPGLLVAPRPLDIALRREGDDDKRYKATGINVEVQTGDPQFDDAVYINTYAAPPDVVRKVFASPGVRAAARELLERDGTRVLLIDDKEGDVSIDIADLTERTPDQERGARLVDNLARLANALPPVRESGETPAEDPTLMPIGCGCLTALVGLFVAPFLYVSRSSRGCRATEGEVKNLLCWSGLDCCNPGFTGLVFGAVVSLPIMFILGRVIRGQSDSHASMRVLQITAFMLCCEIGVALGRLLF